MKRDKRRSIGDFLHAHPAVDGAVPTTGACRPWGGKEFVDTATGRVI